MRSPQRLVVFDARALRGLITNNQRVFIDELAAFRVAFQARRFQIVLTGSILLEYQKESNRPPQFSPQPTLQMLTERGRIVYLDEPRLNRTPVALTGLPKEHRSFMLDSIASGAEYFITKRSRWLNMLEEVRVSYGLQIVSPARFVELER